MHKYLLLLLLISFTACRTLNPAIMFQSEKEAAYSTDSSAKSLEYVIATHDRLEMHVYSNDGFRLVDITQAGTSTGGENVNYIVQEDGQVKLPIIGKTMMKGMTLRQAEQMLEERYSKYYLDPFIMMRVVNRNALVFLGDGGKGIVVNLVNDNTSIIEALAMAGGIPQNSKAYKIKVIRGDLHNPKVYLIDLSTIEGMKMADLTVQSNDIIYVEGRPGYSTKVLTQITPVIGILTSILLVANLFKK